jgi:hypothetical protein
MKYKYINYIVTEFQKQYPTTPTDRLEAKLQHTSEDELYRIANAIERFGVESLVSLVKKSV